MWIVWAVTALLSFVAVGVVLARAVRADGLGHRPPPPTCVDAEETW